MDFKSKVLTTIQKHKMLDGGERVLIALSGGPDSVCLTLALHKLSKMFHLTLDAIYIDHGLRPDETPAEAQFCKDFCQGLGIGYHYKAIDVKTLVLNEKMNKHEAARLLRYHALDETALFLKSQRIALGHNQNDVVETFFINMMRGSGTRGLGGIPAVRGIVIRPLIESTREEIEAFLKAEDARYVVDSSNLKTDYTRNKIRAKLFPVIKDIFPEFIKTVSKTAEILTEEDRHLEIIVTKTLMRLIYKKTDSRIILFMTPLESMDIVILRRTIRRAIAETWTLRGLSFVHIEEIIGLIKKGKPGDRVCLPGGIQAIRDYATFVITTEEPVIISEYALEPDSEVIIKETGDVITAKLLDGKPAKMSDDKSAIVLDADKVQFPLIIRHRREGDFFHPLGLGGKKKIQDYFVDEKVSKELRDSVPIVASGGEIVWVAGMRMDDRFKTDETTKNFLQLTIRKHDSPIR